MKFEPSLESNHTRCMRASHEQHVAASLSLTHARTSTAVLLGIYNMKHTSGEHNIVKALAS